MEKATVIIIAYNKKDQLIDCIGILEKNYIDCHIIIVDNGSNDGLLDWLMEHHYDYIAFDEGRQEYGKALNAVFENFAIEDYVVFLEPEYLIGKETIGRMIKALQISEDAGMVGCCVNEWLCEQYVKLDSLSELYQLEQSEQNMKIYKVVACRNGCLAAKRQMLEQIGAFDEHYAHSIYTMVDYQLRVVRKGYKNYLVKNAFIYLKKKEDEQSKIEKALYYYDNKTIKDKWDMNYFDIQANSKFLTMINRQKEEEFSLLEVGCDMGANLLEIKNEFPNCRIYGLELNQSAVEVGKHLADIVWGNIEDKKVPFHEKFDYVLFGDVLEHLRDPQSVICYCKEILKEDGRILASIPNLMNVTVMRQLLNGRFTYEDIGLLDKTHIHMFTYKEIVRMFEESGYDIENISTSLMPLSEEDRELISNLMKISTDVESFMYETFQYNVIARKCTGK